VWAYVLYTTPTQDFNYAQHTFLKTKYHFVLFKNIIRTVHISSCNIIITFYLYKMRVQYNYLTIIGYE